MKIILLQDIDKLGKKYEVKEVKDGYARNFLIPRGLIKLATEANMKELKIKKEAETKKAEGELKKNQELATKIDGLELTIPVKVGEEEQMFESINSQKICDVLKGLGFGIKKSQVDLSEPIKELGESVVKIKFEHNLEAEVRITIVEEK